MSLAATTAFAAPHPVLPPINTPEALEKACDAALSRTRTAVAAMEKKTGGAGFFAEWNEMQLDIDDVLGVIYLMGEVHPDKAVRNAAEPCLTKFTALNTELFQNEKLYARVQATKAANPHQAKLRKDLVEGFEDSGVALPPDKRARAKEIFDKLEELRQAFDRNIRDDPTRVTFTAAEMEGMPDSLPEGAPGRRWTRTATTSSRSLSRRTSRSCRARASATPASATTGEVQRGRPEEPRAAGLRSSRCARSSPASYGLPTFADYVLRRRMVGSTAVVSKFLADVKGAVTELEKKELEELRAEKARGPRQAARGR
jgi:thimet oligopeptidase